MMPPCAEICSKLHIYERSYLRYTKCIRRGIELLVSNRPEEVVRQVLLYFLVHESGLFPDIIDVSAEQDNLDIAIYRRSTETDFRPSQAPLAIVEVKREQVNLVDHEAQLFQYMKQNRAKTGILFNGNEILTYEGEPGGIIKEQSLASLNDLRVFLLQRAEDQEQADLFAFKQAQEGNVENFIYLANKYGKYAVHKFKFVLNSSPDPIVGCFFRAKGNTIYYQHYGMYSKKREWTFNRTEFDRLLSLVY